MQSGPTQLTDWMDRRHVNQREAAELLGIDFTVLNHYLTGRRSPSLENAIRIERVTGIAVEAWLPTSDGKQAVTTGAGADKRR